MQLYDQLKALLSKMGDLIQPREWRPVREATPQKRRRLSSRQNHGQGESKTRRKLAAASNRINRKRVKHWRH